jgi:predicted metal-dependent peptidase
MKASDKIIKSKITLSHPERGVPFWAIILNKTKIKEDNNIPTMCVNHKGEIYYNTKFIEELTQDEVTGLLIHELGHKIFHHTARLMTKENAALGNISCDLVVNDMLKYNGFTLPKGGLIPNNNHEFEIETPAGSIWVKNINKKSAEDVYRELKKYFPEKPQQGGGQGQGRGDGPSRPLTDQEIKDVMKKLREARIDKHDFPQTSKEAEEAEEEAGKFTEELIRTCQSCKLAGTMPLGLSRLIDTIIKPKIKWPNLIKNWASQNLISDYTYMRPNRSFHATQVYMPTVKKENLNIIFAADMSGSIGEDDIKEFKGAGIDIAKSFSNVSVRFITFDTEVHDDYIVKNGNIQKIKDLEFHGGGGTEHQCVLDYIEQNKLKPKGIIWLTDGYFFSEFEKQKFDNVFVLTTDGTEAMIKDGASKIIKIKR